MAIHHRHRLLLVLDSDDAFRARRTVYVDYKDIITTQRNGDFYRLMPISERKRTVVIVLSKLGK